MNRASALSPWLLAAACASGPVKPGMQPDATGGGNNQNVDGHLVARDVAGTGGSGGSGAQPPPADGGSPSDRPVGGDSRDGPPADVSAGPEDGSREANPAAGPCTAIFCEDFEQAAALDPALWSVTTSEKGDGVTVQSGMAAHGQRAVRFHAVPGHGYVYMVTKSVPAALHSHLFGRVYFYLTPQEPSGHGALLWAGHVGGHPYTGIGWSQNDVFAIYASGDRSGENGGKIMYNRWTCIEWEFNDQIGTGTMWLDGKQTGMTHPFGSNGGLAQMGFGFKAEAGSITVTSDLYLDDIAVDTKRVGCID